MLQKYQDLLKKKDELPAELMVSFMQDVSQGKEVNNLAIEGSVKIHKMPNLTDEQKKKFIEFMKANPFELYNDEVLLDTTNNLITIRSSNSNFTTTSSLKVENKMRTRHGERKLTYNNGDHETQIWKDGKCQSETSYKKGLTRHIDMENKKTTFGQFDHLPKASNPTEQTLFVKFQQNLIGKLKLLTISSRICIHNIPDYKDFADWTNEFAKSNNYQIDGDGEHLRITGDIPR